MLKLNKRDGGLAGQRANTLSFWVPGGAVEAKSCDFVIDEYFLKIP